jgi:Protein RETICULATA-related
MAVCPLLVGNSLNCDCSPLRRRRCPRYHAGFDRELKVSTDCATCRAGFRERLMADSSFFVKVAIECGIGIFTKCAAEYEKRKVRLCRLASLCLVYCYFPSHRVRASSVKSLSPAELSPAEHVATRSLVWLPEQAHTHAHPCPPAYACMHCCHSFHCWLHCVTYGCASTYVEPRCAHVVPPDHKKDDRSLDVEYGHAVTPHTDINSCQLTWCSVPRG